MNLAENRSERSHAHGRRHRDLLSETFRRLGDLGVSYLKLDFLYGGAVPGRRHEHLSGTEAYRSGLAPVRETVGPDVYRVGCGAPLLSSVGLVDAIRVSPDTFHEGGEDGSTGLRGLMPFGCASPAAGPPPGERPRLPVRATVLLRARAMG